MPAAIALAPAPAPAPASTRCACLAAKTPAPRHTRHGTIPIAIPLRITHASCPTSRAYQVYSFQNRMGQVAAQASIRRPATRCTRKVAIRLIGCMALSSSPVGDSASMCRQHSSIPQICPACEGSVRYGRVVEQAALIVLRVICCTWGNVPDAPGGTLAKLAKFLLDAGRPNDQERCGEDVWAVQSWRACELERLKERLHLT
jgi:hypothetical protein